MLDYGFGQPAGGVIQMAYVVKDIQRSIAHWIDDLKVGPWFLLDHFTGIAPVYRGAPSLADVKIAMAFAGHMQIELIQPNDDHPSVYREAIAQRGYGHHHIGLGCADVEAAIDAYQKRGYSLAFKAGVPTGGDVAYLQADPADASFIELIPATPGMDETFTRFWRASVEWDGADPIRPFG